MSRLRSRKAELSADLEQRRSAAVRFEGTPDDAIRPAIPAALEESRAKSRSDDPPPDRAAETEEAESYTSRLLKAKKQVWKDREQ